jgi:hypothetical protein
MQQAQFYGLDIETDTRRDPADPAVAPITRVALSGRSFDVVFTGEEHTILGELDEHLAALRPGVLATWNGSAFDLPFIADRARLLGVELGLELCLDRRLTLHRALLPGHPGAYRGAWFGHGHVDTFRLYGDSSPSSPWTSLRTIGRVLGLSGPDGPNRSRDLTNEALHAHAPSDARLARVLAERRCHAALRMVDRVTHEEAQPVAVAARRLERQARHEGVAVRPAVLGL